MWSEKSEPFPAAPGAGEQWHEQPPPPRGNPNERGQMVGADNENGYPESEAGKRKRRLEELEAPFQSLFLKV
jgi:hypothetical protein